MICVSEEDATILVVSENGYGKRTMIGDYRITNRGGKGVKTINVTDKTGVLISIQQVTDMDELMIINKSGLTIRMAVSDLRVMGRATQGVKLINLKDGDGIASVAKIEKSEEDDIEDVEDLNENGGDSGEEAQDLSENSVDTSGSAVDSEAEGEDSENDGDETSNDEGVNESSEEDENTNKIIDLFDGVDGESTDEDDDDEESGTEIEKDSDQ